MSRKDVLLRRTNIKKKKKLLNSNDYTTEWVAVNFNQTFTSRQTCFMATAPNLKRVGLKAFANRLNFLNNRIPLEKFNCTYETFKVHSKKEFL